MISQGGASEEFIDNLPKLDDKAAAALEQGDGTSAHRNVMADKAQSQQHVQSACIRSLRS